MLKSTIPIANIRIFDDAPTVVALERRFSRFLRDLREQRENAQQTEIRVDGRSEESLPPLPLSAHIEAGEVRDP